MAEMDATAYCKRGDEYSEKGDYDLAIADLTEAIRLEPNFAPTYLSRGMAYANKKDDIQSILDYTEVIRLSISNALVANAYYNRGVAYERQGSYKAVEDFEKASSLDPNDADSRNAIEATKTKLLRTNETNLRRTTLWIDNQVKKAGLQRTIEKHTEELRINPNSASAYFNRGVAYKEQGTHNAALEDLGKASNLEPANDSYRKAFEQAKEAKQNAAEIGERKASREKLNRRIRHILGCTIGLFLGIICVAFFEITDNTAIRVLFGLALGVALGIVLSFITGECISAGEGAKKGALIGGISYGIILGIVSGHFFTGLLIGAIFGVIGGVIIGALGGSILSNYVAVKDNNNNWA